MKNHLNAGHAPASQSIAPSEMVVRLMFLVVSDIKSPISQALLAVDAALVLPGKHLIRNSALFKAIMVFLMIPLGIVLACLSDELLARSLHQKNHSLILAFGSAALLLQAIVFWYSSKFKRYLTALDILAEGDYHRLAEFRNEHAIVLFVQHRLDNTVTQINRLRQTAEEDSQTSTLLHDREGDLIRLVEIFDGVQGLYTGPAKTLLREGGIDLDRKKK